MKADECFQRTNEQTNEGVERGRFTQEKEEECKRFVKLLDSQIKRKLKITVMQKPFLDKHTNTHTQTHIRTYQSVEYVICKQIEKAWKNKSFADVEIISFLRITNETGKRYRNKLKRWQRLYFH